MSKENDGSAVIEKWRRKHQDMEDADKAAKQNMKSVIREAMQDESTHRNIARELLDARRGGHTMKNREGFGDDGEIITGRERPWERE